MKIVIAPNEDGFGTSVWAMRLAKEFYQYEQVSEIRVIFATDKREKFHGDKYPQPFDSKVKLVRLPSINNKIELVTKAGAIDIPESIRQCILPYSQSRVEYEEALAKRKVFEGADLLIDLGVPQVVRAASRENLKRRPKLEKEIIVVTTFDHAWSLSLLRMISSDKTGTVFRSNIQDTLTDIQNDEALTQKAFLFGEPVCPTDYHEYWKTLLVQAPAVIPGSLGGPLSTLEYVCDPRFESLHAKIENGGQCPQEAYDLARKYARKLLKIEDKVRTLFISGAGTPVWDGILKDLVDSYKEHEPNYNVVIYSPSEVKNRNIKLTEESLKFNGVERKVRSGKFGKILFIDNPIGEAHPVLFPAFDLVLTRAGGGTVNDAISSRVPLILVEEPGHWQVEQIRQSCLRMGIAKGIMLNQFQKLGRKCVESKDTLKDLEQQKQNIMAIPNHGEIWLAQELLKLLPPSPTTSSN
jgi:hypothetical protein